MKIRVQLLLAGLVVAPAFGLLDASAAEPAGVSRITMPVIVVSDPYPGEGR